MKKFTLFFLVFSMSISAQIKGVVKDSISGKPISLVGIWSINSINSTTSDKNGKFKLSTTVDQDSLLFFTSGYYPKKVSKLHKEVLLKPVVQENLSSDKFEKTTEFLIKNDNLKFPRSTIYYDSESNTNYIIAQFIPFNDNYYNKIFKKLELGTLSTIDNAKIKIRLFDADSFGNPSSEINFENIIVKVDAKTSKDYTGISEIDFEKLNIKFPSSGVFVAFEFLSVDENISTLQNLNGVALKKLNPCVLANEKVSNDMWEFRSGFWQKLENANEIAMKLTVTN